MERIYDKRNKYTGYLDGNTVYDRRNNIIGYIQNNRLLDSSYNSVSFINKNVIYTIDGRSWCYLEDGVLRSVSGKRLSSAEYSWQGGLAAALIAGRGRVWHSVGDNYHKDEAHKSHGDQIVSTRESDYEEERSSGDTYRIGKYSLDRAYVKNAFYLGKTIFNATGGMSGPVGRYILGKSTGVGLSLLSRLLVK